jgi:hypothetical protein
MVNGLNGLSHEMETKKIRQQLFDLKVLSHENRGAKTG